jgi:hypothetical protein
MTSIFLHGRRTVIEKRVNLLCGKRASHWQYLTIAYRHDKRQVGGLPVLLGDFIAHLAALASAGLREVNPFSSDLTRISVPNGPASKNAVLGSRAGQKNRTKLRRPPRPDCDHAQAVDLGWHPLDLGTSPGRSFVVRPRSAFRTVRPWTGRANAPTCLRSIGARIRSGMMLPVSARALSLSGSIGFA